uniref:Guanylate cyclase n=1 Tax=Ixodes ricinus TaxID=34613 RepID=A0A147BCC9_IXORI
MKSLTQEQPTRWFHLQALVLCGVFSLGTCHNFLKPCRVPESQENLADERPEISIGFLGTFNNSRMLGKMVSGAVPLAVSDINKDDRLLPGFRLTFKPENVGQVGTSVAIQKMTSLWQSGVVAFIGPDESCYAEALVADAWNMPMITYRCSDLRVSGPSFRTFARTLPPLSKVSKSVMSLLRYYKWDQVTLVVSDRADNRLISEVLSGLAREHNVTVQHTYYVPDNYRDDVNGTVKKIVHDSHASTRVYVMLAETGVLVDFVRFMHDEHLLEGGEYVVISVEEEDIYDKSNKYQYMKKDWEDSPKVRPFPFRAVLLLSPSVPASDQYQKFSDAVLRYAETQPLCIPMHTELKFKVPIYAGMTYDAVMLWARAATEVLRENGTINNGTAIGEKIRKSLYRSALGFDIRVDENGDAEGNYTVLAFSKPDDEQLTPVGRFTLAENTSSLPEFKPERPIAWLGGGPPVSEPKCGFKKDKCVSKQDWRILVICVTCACVFLVFGIFAFRHYHYEYKLARLLWKVDMEDVITLRTNSEYSLQNIKNTINYQGFDVTRLGFAFPDEHQLRKFDRRLHGPHHKGSSSVQDHDTGVNSAGRARPRVGFYKGNVVFIKPIFKKSIDLTRSIRKELIEVREMRHENITPFIGACVDPPNICILTVFSARGSLEDVLRNEDLDLDSMFVSSLVADLIKGMIYIHDSEIVSHGNLRSSNCLVDSRWVLQIADFGLHEFRAAQTCVPQKVSENAYRGLLWRAPELLRLMNPPARGTQKGDVYSFGIILFEIIGRAGPWGSSELPTKYIVERVRVRDERPPFRPPVQQLVCADYVLRCMQDCWDENPDNRPDFRFVNVKLRQMQAGLKPNIFDNMIAMMEKYAYNLESLVQERTMQLMEEKKKTENLLLRMLPKSVAEQLKRGEQVEAESFDSVTIYFSDIVGFTALSAVSSPLQVVDLLNDLYTCFDSIIGHYDVYKVETIGDAYMVVSGLPLRNGDRHAGEIASLALHLLTAIQNFEIRHRTGERLKLRIGIHSGPCVAGVVGLKMPRFCLFGDTVNTASRMESTGEALKIHVSEACKNILEKLGGYRLCERGLTPIKGKGDMRTFWLLGKENTPEQVTLPDPGVLANDQCGSDQHNSPQTPVSSSSHRSTSRLQVPTLADPEPLFPLLQPIGRDNVRGRRNGSCRERRHGYLGEPCQNCSGVDGECCRCYHDVSLLLGSESDPEVEGQASQSRKRPAAQQNYNSCLSLFQECKKSLLRELKKDSRTGANGYRSAPIITLRERSTPDCIL